MKIQIGNTTKELLDKVGGFYCEKRGYVHLKGKGKFVMHFPQQTSDKDFILSLCYQSYENTMTLL